MTPGWAWATMVLQTPIYFFLHIYFESIIPDAYGVTETCCFCLRSKRKLQAEDDETIDDSEFGKPRDGNDSLRSSTINEEDNRASGPIAEEFKEPIEQRLLNKNDRQMSLKRKQSEARR